MERAAQAAHARACAWLPAARGAGGVRARHGRRLPALSEAEVQHASSDELGKAPALALGDLVVGKVLRATPKGAQVALLDFPGVTGYMPCKEGPFTIKDGVEDNPWAAGHATVPCLPEGLTREFRVMNVSAGDAGDQLGSSAASGPLLSARALDQDLVWHRASQMLEACTVARENFTIRIDGVNHGGMVARIGGLGAFIPISQISKKGSGQWWTEQEMEAAFAGKDHSVSIMQVDRSSRKVVCSLLRADENDSLRRLQVGALVRGKVRRVESFGAFVGLEGTRTSGLLHISNVSRQHVQDLTKVFSVGDEVWCLVMGLEPDFSNISLSIAELEPEDGDILANKQRVWEQAEEQAKLFQEHLETLRDSGFDFAQYYEEAGQHGA